MENVKGLIAFSLTLTNAIIALFIGIDISVKFSDFHGIPIGAFVSIVSAFFSLGLASIVGFLTLSFIAYILDV